jgi:hypothetical protein
MSHLVSRNTRAIGDVAVNASLRASLRANLLASCSGTIAHSQNFDTTHRFKKSSNLGCNSILPDFGKFSQVLSKFSKVSAPTFEAIGGAV